MSRQFHKLPSEILRIEDEYTAFCFDEACSDIISHLMNGDEPTYVKLGMSKESSKHYSTMSEFFNQIERR